MATTAGSAFASRLVPAGPGWDREGETSLTRKIVLGLVLPLIFCCNVLAEEMKRTPEEEKAKIHQTMQMITPIFGQMMKVISEAQLEVLANPSTAEKLASYTRNYYKALIKKGFRKKDALRLVMAAGFPNISTLQK